jgi:YD repeat-containing protein
VDARGRRGSYDPLDQLTTVTQGSQTKSFKYDSLGRLTRQKLAEQTATINDAGTYVGPTGQGATWSDAFTYDARSNITKRIDARGVETDFSYLISGNTDPLNRLQGISYDASAADQAYYTLGSAPAVTLSYMTTGDQTRVASVTTAGVATETNGYDTEGRISDYTLTLASRSSYPMQTSYSYDTANRLTQITYPAQYGIAGSPRKTVTPCDKLWKSDKSFHL